MKERYKAILDREPSFRRKSGVLCRRVCGTKKGEEGDLLVTLTKHSKRSSKVQRYAVSTRLSAELSEAYGIDTGQYVTMEYEQTPEGCIFIVRKATEETGLLLYRQKSELGCRASFTPTDQDIVNLFPDVSVVYRCELKYHDEKSGAFVFEEIK